MIKTKVCKCCYQSFTGRRDAKTCSARCRKRFQRLRDSLNRELDASSASTSASSKVLVGMGQRLAILLVVVVGALLISGGSGFAASLAQGYTTQDSNLQPGMAVALSSGSSNSKPLVQAASSDASSKFIGIDVTPDSSLLTLSPAGSQVYVASSGQVKAYVSQINGTIKQGDLLGLSGIRGVLVKGDATQITAGRALQNFPATDEQTISVKNADGKTVSAQVALMNIAVSIKPGTTGLNTPNNVLSTLGTSITSHKVNGLRILAALTIFSTLLVIEGEIIYGTITASILAISRNPLAKRAILWQALRSMGFAAVILLVCTAAIGGLLWL